MDSNPLICVTSLKDSENSLNQKKFDSSNAVNMAIKAADLIIIACFLVTILTTNLLLGVANIRYINQLHLINCGDTVSHPSENLHLTLLAIAQDIF